MTVQQMLNALPVVQRITELKLPIKTAYKVYSLAKSINDKRDFFINEEKKMIEQFQAEVSATGQISFKDENTKNAFTIEHDALLNCEIDDIQSLDLSFDDLKDSEFSPIEIIMLEGVINFID